VIRHIRIGEGAFDKSYHMVLPTEPTDQSQFSGAAFCGDPSHSDRGKEVLYELRSQDYHLNRPATWC
jgi:hypothetical protein